MPDRHPATFPARMADDDEKLAKLAKGFRARTLVTARLASKMGARYVKKSLGVADKRDTEAAVAAAGELVREMGKLKGLVMKFGQIASYMPGAMPPEAQRVLAELQAQSIAMQWEVVQGVVASELGLPAAEAFESFEEAPFAAASIGQVHRARFNGREVAVKIQYPGIEELIVGDVKTVGLLTRLSSVGMAYDAGALVSELHERLIEECDYLYEADNQRLFARLWTDHPMCRVPEVFTERTTKRVLTTELVHARDFQRFCSEGTQAEKDRAGAVIFETCFDSIFRYCVYNADPHPGNYLFHDDGHVTFLDFGCVRTYTPKMIEVWKRTALSVLNDDLAAFKQCYAELGFAPNPKKFDWDHQWNMMHYLYRPFMQKEPFTYTQEYVRESYGMMLFDNPNRFRTGMPPEWLFLNRLQWGLNSVLALLSATGPWPELWRRAVESKLEPVSR